MSKNKGKTLPHKIYYRELETEGQRAEKDWMTFDPKGSVYLIGNKALGWYKIGLTRNNEAPDVRFKTIQQGVPFDLDFVRYWFVPHARSFEKLIHYEMRGSKIRGEWFSFPSSTLDDVVARIQSWADKVPVMDDSLENQQDTDKMVTVRAGSD
jgi:hypothetical protein